MSFELAGFADRHTHLLRTAAGAVPPYDLHSPESIAAHHRSVWSRRTTPMDEPYRYTTSDLPGALHRGLRAAATLGLCEIWEAGLDHWDYLDALRSLRDRGPLPLRVRILVASGLADETGAAHLPRLGDPWVDVVGVKFYADGWLGPRTCALCAPYADDGEAGEGVLFLDAVTLARRAEPYAEAGWTIATHAIGDRAIEQVLEAYEMVFGSDCPAAAPRVEHAQVLAPHLVERMAHLGVVACIQPGFAVSDAASARAALGPERSAQAYAWGALLDAGVRVVGGSDYPIEPLSPLAGLQRLVTGAPSPGAPAVAERLDTSAAIALMTDESCGTTVLDVDPAEVDPDELHSIQVLEVQPAS